MKQHTDSVRWENIYRNFVVVRWWEEEEELTGTEQLSPSATARISGGRSKVKT